jgi:hypothetical protein
MRQNVAKEYSWAITHVLRGHAVADQVPVFWRLDFNWAALCVRT